MASVTYDHVYKRFGDVVAVNDLNIQIEDKEFLVFVGPSGCGKTTSLRLLAGLEEISEGNIMIGDRVVNDVPPKDRDIAMVFQSYALYPHMSVYDNMAFGLKLRKTPKADIDRRVKEAADILDIGHLLDRKPKQLSGGQRQRVAVGRAIVREPAVFLFDEPLSNLDAKLRVQTRAQLTRLHQRLATTFIYVSAPPDARDKGAIPDSAWPSVTRVTRVRRRSGCSRALLAKHTRLRPGSLWSPSTRLPECGQCHSQSHRASSSRKAGAHRAAACPGRGFIRRVTSALVLDLGSAP